jgi:NitT/TauT family transport system permease protein
MKFELLELRREPGFWTSKALGVLLIGLILLVWWAMTRGAAESRAISPDVLPSPGETFSSFGSLVDRGLVPSIFASLKRLLWGFGLAIVVGVPLGMLAGTWLAVHAFLTPLVIFGRNIPIAALIPLTVLWWGIDEKQKEMFIFIATVPFLFSDAAAAVAAIPQRYVETAQTLGASSRQVFLKVLVPLSLPQIYTGLRHLFGLAFGYIVLAEVINTNAGLGKLIELSERDSKTTHMILLLLVITVLAYAIDRLMAFFERGLFPYRHDQ